MRTPWLATLLVCLAWPAQGAGLVDPTRPQAYTAPRVEEAAEAAGEWKLQYIAVRGERAVAVINGQRVGIGDRVADATVVRIRPGQVRLRQGGEMFDLSMGYPAIRNRKGE